MKKRYFVIGLIALEILCIPLSAQLIHHAAFSKPGHAVATQLPQIEAGATDLVVSSNTPFTISAAHVTGRVDIHVIGSGSINDTRFGDNAQMPGPAKACAIPAPSGESIIYTSALPTIKTQGEILSQSVIIKLRYAQGSQPKFEVRPVKKSLSLSFAAACGKAQDQGTEA